MSYYLSLAIDIIATIASVFVLTLILIQLRQQNKQARFQALDQVQRRLAASDSARRWGMFCLTQQKASRAPRRPK
jgi:hypothetical protein